MMNPLYQSYAQHLDQLKQRDNFRSFKSFQNQDKYIIINHHKMLNLSSNDYLGLAQNQQLKQQFFDEYSLSDIHFSSSSSRLLTGNFPILEQLEQHLNEAFLRHSLVFNSGYHMNIGILPALSDPQTLIISDEYIHASMIDGIRLSKAQKQRYPHQDLHYLEQLLIQANENPHIEKVIIATESVYSMDGDITDLPQLIQLKHKYPKVMLYVDEAHAIGVYGTRGLGCVEHFNCIQDIDFIVGTFGKALNSVGGYLICDDIIRDYLVNTMRSLIFSTALPPMNIAWTDFMFRYMQSLTAQRQHLATISQQFKQHILEKGLSCPSHSHIIPIIYGDNARTILKAEQMQKAGFYVLPIRPPTVPANTARVRISLDAQLQWSDLQALIEYI